MSVFDMNDPSNLEYLDQQYSFWLQNPRSVEPSLNGFFTGLAYSGASELAHRTVAESTSSSRHPAIANGTNGYAPLTALPVETRHQTAAVRMITAYRDVGHLIAKIDPLANESDNRPMPWLLDLNRFYLSESDLDARVDASMIYGVSGPMTLRDILSLLKETYCGTVGIEYMHIQNFEARRWLAERLEPTRSQSAFSLGQKYRILITLKHAQMFEDFLANKYMGHKRFGLEGGETLIPMLDSLIEAAPGLGVREIVIGMAHRGRLNVLCNILQKPYGELFNEFEDRYDPKLIDGDGDVKYHLGYSADVQTHDGKHVHLSLTANPSHLEIVNPIVEGRVRAKQKLHNDNERKLGVPLLIHGDAAFAGQGVVAETLNMYNLTGYRTGGTIHIVVNNQIGFTTPPRDARSTQYCTDIAKFIQAPIFHVNSEDPEACVRIARLALEYRQAFKSDVVIDLVCYRKLGHNETDEPAFTQPVEYRKIGKKPRIAGIYADQLVARGDIKAYIAEAIDKQFETDLDSAVQEFQAKLTAALEETRKGPPQKKGMKGYSDTWTSLRKEYSHDPVDTTITTEIVQRIAEQLVNFPAGFTTHPKLGKRIDDGKGGFRYPSGDTPYKRRDDIVGGKPLDWGTGEALAYGSLVLEGCSVRLSGQDSRRGTFSHRHAVLYDYNTGEPFCPLAALASSSEASSASFDVFDSHLSEAAVLGFEYGYSLDSPNTLVLWEAQFGDFVNGAQVVIDQFLTSAESKWNRSSGLVLLLPHGYEGAGPEHSSARPERFLQLCADDNIQVVNCTTPAQFFHALRRQMKRPFRKPLIVMTPKSLLRHPLAVSPLSDFTGGRFHEVIDDPGIETSKVRRVILCHGKIYYDLLAARTEGKVTIDKNVTTLTGHDSAALVRIEQLYPWPMKQLRAVLTRYPDAEIVWAQEEPKNMNAWFFVKPLIEEMGYQVKHVCRSARSSPAVGSKKVHDLEQARLVEAALTKPAPLEVA